MERPELWFGGGQKAQGGVKFCLRRGSVLLMGIEFGRLERREGFDRTEKGTRLLGKRRRSRISFPNKPTL